LGIDVGDPILVDIMDLLLRRSLQGILTGTFMLVSGGNPLFCMLGRVRDGRSRIGPTGKITGIVSSQFSKLVFQPLRFGVLCFPAMIIYVGSKLSEMLDFCFDIRSITSRLCLKQFLLLALA
jgi:hypothetical protein